MITTTKVRHAHAAFDGRPCEVYAADMQVKNDRSDSYLYPDVVVTCQAPKFEDDAFDALLNPQVIVEVLSNSTGSFDRGAKFEDYKLLLSLKEYVRVSQNQPLVHSYTRETDSTWKN